MKKPVLLLFTILIYLVISGQQLSSAQDALNTLRQAELKSWNEFRLLSEKLRGDPNIDVKFYYLDIEIAIDSSYITGEVLVRFTPTINGLDELSLDLNNALTVTNISSPCSSFLQDDNKIQIDLDQTYDTGDLIDITISYHGKPKLAGGYKGLRYETHGNNEPVIATLSTPFVAHYWYPCKDGPEDKADSVYIDITIENKLVNGIEMRAVSNGVLEQESIIGDKKTFYWRHRYPIVPYYVMAAISNYIHFEDEYENESGDILPLDYYAFAEDLEQQQAGVVDMPEVFNLFDEKFGPYPFSNEKYGMTQLGYYGAIENQTNTITNSMKPSWFMTSVHELGHMWFGDMITCETWNHAWINEGFATYSEALWTEHDLGKEAYKSYMNNLQYFGEGSLYLENPLDTFNVFTAIIYYKGAWALHMLRGVVGDELFFESLNNYATDTSLVYQTATTEDVQSIFELTCNTDLDYFFDQWIYDEYYPVYHYNFTQISNKLYIMLYQAQEELYGRRPVFEMPVQLHIDFFDGTDTTITVWNDMQLQQFEFITDKEVIFATVDPEKWILRKSFYKPDLPVSISESTVANEIYFYPNPFTEKLYVDVMNPDIIPFKLTLYDINGKVVSTQLINAIHTQLITERLENGTYFYSIASDEINYPFGGKIFKR